MYSISEWNNTNGRQIMRSSISVCLYYKQKGHITMQCWELDKKETRTNSMSKLMQSCKTQLPLARYWVGYSGKWKETFYFRKLCVIKRKHSWCAHCILRHTGVTKSPAFSWRYPTFIRRNCHVIIITMWIVYVPMHMI